MSDFPNAGDGNLPFQVAGALALDRRPNSEWPKRHRAEP